MKLNRKPFIGLLAFVLVLFTMPLGHTLMILIEESYKYVGATMLGLLGVVLLLFSLKYKKESTQTFLGLFAGLFIWTGFIEFSFVYYAQSLEISPLMENGEVATKPEYLIMPSSIGLLIAATLYFFMDSKTRCNLFTSIRKWTGLNIPVSPVDKNKNFASITAIETVFVIWTFYILLLVVYDEKIFGSYHPATYVVMVGSLVWSGYLFLRLLKFAKLAPAIRYAIPTVVVFWNVIEILGRWNFFTEIWIEPAQYTLELSLIFSAFIGITVLAVLVVPKEQTQKKIKTA